MAIQNGLTISEAHARPALILLRENLVAARALEPQYDSAWGMGNRGDTVPIRVPAKFTTAEKTNDGARTFQTVDEGEVELTLNFLTEVPIELNERQMSYGLDDFTEQITMPAVNILARTVDRNIIGTIGRQLTNVIGKSLTTPAASSAVADVIAMDEALNEANVPMMGRIGIVNAKEKAGLIGIPTFHEADKRGDMGSALESAMVGDVFGISFSMDQNVQWSSAASSTGWLTDQSTVAVGATTMHIDTGSNRPAVGDVFKVGDDTWRTITKTFASGTEGDITFTPALTGAVADNQALTFIPRHTMNFVGNRRAIGLAFVPLTQNVAGAEATTVTDSDTNLSIRLVNQYDIKTGKHQCVYSVLYGVKVIQPELALRLVSV